MFLHYLGKTRKRRNYVFAGHNVYINWSKTRLSICTCHQFNYTHTHTRVNGPFSETTRVSRYQKGKTNLDFTEARDSEWQWHQLGHM